MEVKSFWAKIKQHVIPVSFLRSAPSQLTSNKIFEESMNGMKKIKRNPLSWRCIPSLVEEELEVDFSFGFETR